MLTTYRPVQSTPSEWLIECQAPGKAPSYIWGGFKTAEQAQERAEELNRQKAAQRAAAGMSG
jgi:hypothetical protein